MKTKKVLSVLMVCALLLAACPVIASAATTSSAATASAAKRAKPGGQAEETGILGKITAVSETEITLALASMEKPANSGDGTQPAEKPARDGSSRPEKPAASDTSTSRPEPPAGAPDGTQARGTGRGGMTMTFADETTTYTLSGSVSVKKGMGDNAEALSVSGLAADDIVRIELDDDGNVATIHVMTAPTGNPPAESESSSEE